MFTTWKHVPYHDAIFRTVTKLRMVVVFIAWSGAHEGRQPHSQTNVGSGDWDVPNTGQSVRGGRGDTAPFTCPDSDHNEAIQKQTNRF